jgi:hypothetical protein
LTTFVFVFFMWSGVSHIYERHTLLGQLAAVEQPEHRNGLIIAAVLTIVYLGIEFTVVLVTYSARSVDACVTFVLISVLPGALVLLFFVRFYHLPWIKWKNEPLDENETSDTARATRSLILQSVNCMRCICVETTYAQGHVTQLATVYFIRLYMVLFCFVIWGVLLVIQGSYSFLLPVIYSNTFITDTLWQLRFRVMSVQLMCLPLLISNLAVMLSFSERNADNLDWQKQSIKVF